MSQEFNPPGWLRTPMGRAVVALAMLAGVLTVLDLFGLINELISALAIPAMAFAAVGLTLVNSVPLLRRSHANARRRRAWWCLDAAVVCLGLSALASIATTIFFNQPVAMVRQGELLAGLLAMILSIIGIVLLPSEKLAPRQWIASALDLTTLAIGALLGFWVYALHPLLAVGPRDQISIVVVVGYIATSLFLLGVLLLLTFKRQDPQTRRGVAALATAGGLAVALEVGPLTHLIGSGVQDVAPEYLGWTLFILFVGLAARLMRHEVPTAATPQSIGTNSTIPIASTTLIGSLLFTSLVSRELWQVHAATLLPAMFLAIILIVVRQTLTTRESLRLAIGMQKAKEIAEAANSARLHFLANISHDLRTPLNGVLGCSQILLRDRTVTPKQKDLINTMQGCAEHLRNLINDLLDLSKLEADRLELAPAPCEVRPFFEALQKTFTLEAQNKNIALTLDTDASVPDWIMADRKRMQQILGNLVHNAIKFTDRGGVHVRVRASEGRLRCDVQDSGCGILPDKIGGLFQPFHVVDERSLKLEGTGLGLSIARKLAQKMGGDITVTSVIGRGSVFALAIPYLATAPVIEVQRTVVDYQGRRRRILIVDDQPANRVVLRTMLEPLDFLIDEAGDAAQALRQINFAKPDVALLDLMMPGIDGFELCRQIARLPVPEPIPCIAVSAMSGIEAQQRCTEAGFRELLNKPVNLDLLLEVLRAHGGIEWTYGVLQPPPPAELTGAESTEEIKTPPLEELMAFVDLARRGFVRSLETRAEQLARTNPDYTAFAQRVERYTKNFKVKELNEWLSSLTPETAHGSPH